jgi:hypothetical protein
MAVREETIAREITTRGPSVGLLGWLLAWLSGCLEVREFRAGLCRLRNGGTVAVVTVGV